MGQSPHDSMAAHAERTTYRPGDTICIYIVRYEWDERKRDGEEVIRIISARAAEADEVRKYQEQEVE